MTTYQFAREATASDFAALADYLEAAPDSNLNPLLLGQRREIAGSLRNMSRSADLFEHQQAYHALRLFVR